MIVLAYLIGLVLGFIGGYLTLNRVKGEGGAIAPLYQTDVEIIRTKVGVLKQEWPFK